MSLEPTDFPPGELLADIRALIAKARRQTTVAVNMGLTLLYWRIGRRIHREVLGSERAAYGEQIVVTVRVAVQRRDCLVVTLDDDLGACHRGFA